MTKRKSPKQNSRIIYINARSIKNKRNPLIKLLEEENLDIVITTEHWLRDWEWELLNLSHYVMHACYCRDKNEGGGVAIFLKKNMAVDSIIKLDLNEYAKEKICELASLEIKTSNGDYTVIGVYRSPNADINEFLNITDNVMNLVSDKRLIIIGDFNINVMNSNLNVYKFMDVLESYSLEYVVKEPTRVMVTKNGLTSTCVDNVITNMVNLSTKVKGCNISDHKMILVELNDNIGNKINKIVDMERKINEETLDLTL